MLKRAVRKGVKFQNPVETRVGGIGMALKILPLYLANKEERVPAEALGPFRTDAQLYLVPPSTGLRVTWMGHASILLEIEGVRLLLDPMWDDRASPLSWIGPKRFFPSPLRLEDLPAIDAVIISHDHFDHLGAQTVQALARHPALRHAQWLTSLGVGRLLRGFGVQSRITELDWTDSVTVSNAANDAEVQITALPARHFSGRSLWNRYETLWSSFALQGQRRSVYFGADSGCWEGFAAIGQEHGPFDLTLLDTGASNPLWRDIHMGPEGAVEAFAAMGGGGLLMPIHWGLFDLALHSWRQPVERITELADQLGIKLWSPEPGLPSEVIPGRELRSGWWRPKSFSQQV